MAQRIAILAVLCATCALPQAQAGEKDLQVMLEIRVLSVSEPFFERIGIDFIKDPETPKLNASVGLQALGTAFLGESQVVQLMEAMQSDRRGKVLQFPRLTLLNEQMGTLESTDTKYFMTNMEWVTVDGQVHARPKNEPFKVGSQIWAKPVVSADQRAVRLAIKVQQTDVGSSVPLVPVQIPVLPSGSKPGPEVLLQMFFQQPQFSTLAFEQTVNIPNGRTAVFGGLKRTAEVRNEYSPPVLSKIPYVSRLFRNVGYGQETETWLVLVTPRILVDGQTPRPISSAAAR